MVRTPVDGRSDKVRLGLDSRRVQLFWGSPRPCRDPRWAGVWTAPRDSGNQGNPPGDPCRGLQPCWGLAYWALTAHRRRPCRLRATRGFVRSESDGSPQVNNDASARARESASGGMARVDAGIRQRWRSDSVAARETFSKSQPATSHGRGGALDRDPRGNAGRNCVNHGGRSNAIRPSVQPLRPLSRWF